MKFRIKTIKFQDGRKYFIVEKKYLGLFWRGIPIKRINWGELQVWDRPALFDTFDQAEKSLKEYANILKLKYYKGYRIYPFIQRYNLSVQIYCPSLWVHTSFCSLEELDYHIKKVTVSQEVSCEYNF